MTDLRDRIGAFDAAARTRRLLDQPPARPAPVITRRADCHPAEPYYVRSMCRACYNRAWRNNELADLRTSRRLTEFVADYAWLRSEGYTRRQIAERLGMTYDGCGTAYRRAVRGGLLTPDRRTA